MFSGNVGTFQQGNNNTITTNTRNSIVGDNVVVGRFVAGVGAKEVMNFDDDNMSVVENDSKVSMKFANGIGASVKVQTSEEEQTLFKEKIQLYQMDIRMKVLEKDSRLNTIEKRLNVAHNTKVPITINFSKKTQYVHVEGGNVQCVDCGDLTCDNGNVNVSESVHGDIRCGGSLSVEQNVEGDIHAKGSVTVGGNAQFVEAKGNVIANNIEGSCRAGASIMINK